MAFLGVGVGAFFLVPGRRIRDRDDLPSTSTRALKPGLNPTTPEATEPTEPTEHVSVDSPPVERPVLVPPARKTPAGQAHPQTSRNPAKGLRSGKGGGHSAQETQPSAAAAVAEPASRTDAPLPARETAPQPQPFQGDPGPNGAPIIQDDKETNGSAKKKARGAILQ
jgi:hypothetical protein